MNIRRGLACTTAFDTEVDLNHNILEIETLCEEKGPELKNLLASPRNQDGTRNRCHCDCNPLFLSEIHLRVFFLETTSFSKTRMQLILTWPLQ